MTEPTRNKRPMGTAFTIAFWILLLIGLAQIFGDYLDRRNNPNRHLAAFDISEGNELVLQRNQRGHYLAPGFINGHQVQFLVDTGATSISVPESVAKAAGLEEGRRGLVSTASGVVHVYQTQIEELQLGPIRMRDVRGHINPHMPDNTVLLGMSFMRDLEIIQRDGTLTLRVPQ